MIPSSGCGTASVPFLYERKSRKSPSGAICQLRTRVKKRKQGFATLPFNEEDSCSSVSVPSINDRLAINRAEPADRLAGYSSQVLRSGYLWRNWRRNRVLGADVRQRGSRCKSRYLAASWSLAPPLRRLPTIRKFLVEVAREVDGTPHRGIFGRRNGSCAA